MSEIPKPSRVIEPMSEETRLLLQEVAEQFRGRDMFPEKTLRMRALLADIQIADPNLTPPAEENA